MQSYRKLHKTMPPPRSIWCRISWIVACAICLAAVMMRAPAAQAAEQCPTDPAAVRARAAAIAPRPASPGPALLYGDSMRSLTEDIIELEGDAKATRDGEQITADYLRYDRAQSLIDATGDVSVVQPGGAFETSELHRNLDTGIGTAAAGTYRLIGQQIGRGDMSSVEFLGPERTRLFDVRYTTCPDNRDDWFLRARRLDLDTDKDIGVARNVTLEFLGLPVLYLPYLSFPISDERKSGFLFPQIGYGGRVGTIVATPYYWNIAPNYDATLTPRLLTDRGLQLQGEFRYLGRTFRGQLDAEYLPDDDITGEDRAAGSFVHAQTLSPRWGALVNVRRVSDKDYVSDFGDRLSITSETHLPQTAEINYRGSIWAFAARATDYQTIDRTIAPTNQPYARLPQLLLSASTGTLGGPQYLFAGELVNFKRDVGVTGQRANVAPSVQLPLTRIYGFLVPELGVRHIAYSLDQEPNARPAVTAPFASLDSGLYFEREVTLGGALFDQTLEPRLYYLYVPHRPQDDLPNFDTSIPEFSFADLFRNYRFLGGDRIGDANRLSGALTTRFIDQDTGAERFSASIGRIYHFDERRVNLPAGVIDNDRSDVAAEAVAWLPGNWHARSTLLWAPDRDQAVRGSFYLQYQPAPNRILNLGYLYNRDQYEQVDVSTEWPVGDRWTLRARSLYSIRDADRGNISSFVGAEYRSCCWAVRLYAARGLVQATAGSSVLTEQTTRFLLELELSGLSGSRSAFESPLRQGLFTSFPAATVP